MNVLPTYEQLIAERLGGIEIPDMADVIWSRIEAALDVEMPVNDPSANIQPFYKDPAAGMISGGIIAIIIALFILSKNWSTEPIPPGDLPQQTEPTTKPDTIMKQHFKPPDKLNQSPKKNTRTIDTKPVVDTAAHRTFNEKTDSLLKTIPANIVPPVIKMPPGGIKEPSIDLKQRKKYGVEVSDSDYRFKVKPKG